jgi:hypothetical protein
VTTLGADSHTCCHRDVAAEPDLTAGCQSLSPWRTGPAGSRACTLRLESHRCTARLAARSNTVQVRPEGLEPQTTACCRRVRTARSFRVVPGQDRIGVRSRTGESASIRGVVAVCVAVWWAYRARSRRRFGRPARASATSAGRSVTTATTWSSPPLRQVPPVSVGVPAVRGDLVLVGQRAIHQHAVGGPALRPHSRCRCAVVV